LRENGFPKIHFSDREVRQAPTATKTKGKKVALKADKFGRESEAMRKGKKGRRR